MPKRRTGNSSYVQKRRVAEEWWHNLVLRHALFQFFPNIYLLTARMLNLAKRRVSPRNMAGSEAGHVPSPYFG